MKRITAAVILFMIGCAGILTGCGKSADPVFVSVQNGTDSAADECGSLQLCAYICGEILHPGVYYLEEGSRICDLVDAAGGMTPDAAADMINLAEALTDGQMVKISRQLTEEEVSSVGVTSSDGRININTADETQLMTLPGIGQAKAKSIVSYREQHGAFMKADDLLSVSGIGPGIFDKIKDSITT